MVESECDSGNKEFLGFVKFELPFRHPFGKVEWPLMKLEWLCNLLWLTKYER